MRLAAGRMPYRGILNLDKLRCLIQLSGVIAAEQSMRSAQLPGFSNQGFKTFHTIRMHHTVFLVGSSPQLFWERRSFSAPQCYSGSQCMVCRCVLHICSLDFFSRRAAVCRFTCQVFAVAGIFQEGVLVSIPRLFYIRGSGVGVVASLVEGGGYTF